MAKKVRKTDEKPLSQEPSPKAPKISTILGTDHALTLPTAQGTSLDLSYWDLWFCIVAVLMHDGDLDRLAKRIKDEKSMIRYDRNSIERKRCHIRDLKRRLEEASVIPGDIVLAAVDLAKTEKRRALKKVMESIHREREFSEPMRNTPRKRRFDHALRGYWDRFPVSPEPYAEKIRGALPVQDASTRRVRRSGSLEPWTGMWSRRRSSWKRARRLRHRRF